MNPLDKKVCDVKSLLHKSFMTLNKSLENPSDYSYAQVRLLLTVVIVGEAPSV
jgi:hypothetical protein